MPLSANAGPAMRSADSKPRVLHVIASLTKGGIETWLMHMVRHGEMFSVRHEILVTRELPGAYEQEARDLKIPIHRLPMTKGKLRWLLDFRRFLGEQGPFAAVQSHVYMFSAPVLAVAKSANVPVRIAHCHNARSKGSDHKHLKHRVRRTIAIEWLKHAATRRIGITEAAIEEIAGRGWKSGRKASVLLYGFDFSQNRGAAERAAKLRKTLGIAKDAPVIGHVGRFETVKNQPFLLDAFAALLGRKPDAQLVLVGEGPEQDRLLAHAQKLGISGHVHFPGTTDDVAAYMAMFDLFALTSLSEGLGIVVVEAQAAGTPAIVSQSVPPEVSVIPGAVEHLALESGADAWAETFARRIDEPALDPQKSLEQVEASSFGIGRCIEDLDAIYRSDLEIS